MESKGPDVTPTARDVWMRGLFMLLLIIGFTVGQWRQLMDQMQYNLLFRWFVGLGCGSTSKK
jgi:hypothetical protein